MELRRPSILSRGNGSETKPGPGFVRKQVRLRTGKQGEAQAPKFDSHADGVYLPTERLGELNEKDRVLWGETQSAAVRIIHGTVTKKTEEYDSASDAKKADLDSDKSYGAIATVGALIKGASDPDGPRQMELVTKVFAGSTDNPAYEYPELKVSIRDGEPPVTVRKITGKKGDNFICEIDGEKDTVEIPSGDIVRSFIASNAESIAEAMTDDDERKIISDYAKGIRGEVDDLKITEAKDGEDPGEQTKREDDHRKRIEGVAKKHGMLTVKELKAAAKKMYGIKSDKAPDPNASEYSKRQWEEFQRFDRLFAEAENAGKTLADYDLFSAVAGESLDAELIKLRQDLGTATQSQAGEGEIKRLKQEVQILEVVSGQNRDGAMRSLFNGMQTGQIELSADIKSAIVNADFGTLIRKGSVLGDAKDYAELLTQLDDDQKDREGIAKRNKRFLGGGLLTLMVLAYMAQSQVLGGMNE